ncbi:ABC transporter permease [Phytohabitans kaempferiae]|uniref:ABC transporter permease n=1 Tax=Phytohabitans kaempferiae TaxID=1620943 RepID=A0ABV6LYX0_9ACTN
MAQSKTATGAVDAGLSPPARPAPIGRDGRRTGKPKPKAVHRRSRRTRLGATTVLSLMAVWEVAARTGLLPEEVPPVTDIAAWLAENATTAVFWEAVGYTMLQWLVGVSIGVVCGVTLGFAVAMVPLLERLLRLPLEFIRPIPSIVYLPLMLLLFGATSQTAIMVISVGVFFPMLYQTTYGLRGVDPVAVETARVYGLSTVQRIFMVTLPSALPSIATGLRLAVSVALIIAMAVQLTAGVPGLGSRLVAYQTNGVYPAIYGIVATSGLLGLLVVRLFEFVERRMLRWHEPYRPGGAA